MFDDQNHLYCFHLQGKRLFHPCLVVDHHISIIDPTRYPSKLRQTRVRTIESPGKKYFIDPYVRRSIRARLKISPWQGRYQFIACLPPITTILSFFSERLPPFRTTILGANLYIIAQKDSCLSTSGLFASIAIHCHL